MPKETTSHRAVTDTDGVVIREKSPKQQELQQNLTVRLNHLKVEARDVCQAYLSNLDSDLAKLAEFLDGTSDAPASEKVRSRRLPRLAKILDSVTVKPNKGRSKDLRRIDRAVQALMEQAFE